MMTEVSFLGCNYPFKYNAQVNVLSYCPPLEVKMGRGSPICECVKKVVE